MNLRLWPCGTEVQLKHSSYVGLITSVSIRGLRVAYEIAYFEQELYKVNTFEVYEFDPVGSVDAMTLI